MKSLSTTTRVFKPSKETERQHWIDLTAKMLKLPFIRVAVMVTGWSAEWVKDMYLYVNRSEVENPPALWNWMRKHPKT